MSYADSMAAVTAKRAEIVTLRNDLRALQAKVEPQPVEDYELAGWDGPVRLSELFGDKRDLIVIHNMGAGCSGCTLWADGFNGVYDKLASRVAFVVASPDPVDRQRKFAAGRGWRFPMVSCGASRFAEDMGYRYREGDEYADDNAKMGGWNPGVSVFRRDGDRIVRVSDAEFGGEEDVFCVLFHFFDLLPNVDRAWY
jgi:predicted dithiol-disulfide oxidoreductase (DUF899 family)